MLILTLEGHTLNFLTVSSHFFTITARLGEDTYMLFSLFSDPDTLYTVHLKCL